MRIILNLIKRSYDKKIDAVGLGIFRIFFSIIAFLEVLHLYQYKELIFDIVPGIEPYELNIGLLLIMWLIVLLFVIIGLYTKIALLINYILSVFVFGTALEFEYHMFYAYTGIGFLMLISPVHKSLSLDSLRMKLKMSGPNNIYEPDTKVGKIYYMIFIIVGIGFFYWDSIFYKFSSDIWWSGLGMWVPSSSAYATISNDYWLLNQKEIMTFLGYFTIVFETLFLFLFWVRKLWHVWFIIGVALHLGIYIEFPIPLFALGYIALYFLFIPNIWWFKLKKLYTFKSPKVYFIYDQECPLCNNTVITLRHFDICGAISFNSVQSSRKDFNELSGIEEEVLLSDIHSIDKNKTVKSGLNTYITVFRYIPIFYIFHWILRIPGISHLGHKFYSYVAKNRDTERCTYDNCGYNPPMSTTKFDDRKILKNFTGRNLKIMGLAFVTIILFLLQLNVNFATRPFDKIRHKLESSDNAIANGIITLNRDIGHLSKTFLGITPHRVFDDYHFMHYRQIIAVCYINGNNDEVWLPIIKKDGTPDHYISGATWVNWTFRVNSSKFDKDKLSNGVMRYTAFYALKNKINLNNAIFKVKVKYLDIPSKFEWEKDYLKKQQDLPWENLATISWNNKQFSIEFE